MTSERRMHDNRNLWAILTLAATILFQIVSSTLAHGKLMQKVDDISERVGRIEKVLDYHTQLK